METLHYQAVVVGAGPGGYVVIVSHNWDLKPYASNVTTSGSA